MNSASQGDLSWNGPECEFRFAAEWETPAAIWVAWPHERQTWPGRFDPVPPFFARWIERIAESVPVRVLAAGEIAGQAEPLVGHLSGVSLVDVPTNDCWVRDYGPSFVVRRENGTVEGIDWKYNAWGEKYPPWDDDQAAAGRICDEAGIPHHVSRLCLEGGALETDGRDRLLTTPSCLVSDSRNPGWTSEQIARELYRRLGVTEVVWLDGGGLAGDDTDGHIDQLARFVDPCNVVAAWAEPGDINHAALSENFRQLHLWGDATNPAVQIHKLPLPPSREIDGKTVPQSHCNFLRIGADRAMVPTFGAASDDHAIGLIKELTGADVIGVDCRDLVWGLGALHCASREQPAGND